MSERSYWGEFLEIRSKLIDHFHKEGRSDEAICNTLSMDPMQVFLIRTRDRKLDGPLTKSNLKKRAKK